MRFFTLCITEPLYAQNAATWTSLGLFYLFHEDTTLATEAFYKAQILDPDYAMAWVGRGLVATVEGDVSESRAFFEHSVGLPAPVVSTMTSDPP